MCVAMPGKVISRKDTKAMVDFSGNTIEVEAGLVPVEVGDYVLVHAGCIIQTITEFDKDMLLDLITEMENA
jgi:hydrogenase assembly chaperone HypC/HupF